LSSVPKTCRSSSASPRRDLPRCARWRAHRWTRAPPGLMIAPPPHLRTDEQIHRLLQAGGGSDWHRHSWVLQDYPLTLTVIMTPAVIRKIVMDNPSCVMLKHEDWPGLEKISALRALPEGWLVAAVVDPDRQWRALSRFRDGARLPDGAMNRLCLPGIVGSMSCDYPRKAVATRARSVRRPSAADPL